MQSLHPHLVTASYILFCRSIHRSIHHATLRMPSSSSVRRLIIACMPMLARRLASPVLQPRVLLALPVLIVAVSNCTTVFVKVSSNILRVSSMYVISKPPFASGCKRYLLRSFADWLVLQHMYLSLCVCVCVDLINRKPVH
jgi:hypothetical protein